MSRDRPSNSYQSEPLRSTASPLERTGPEWLGIVRHQCVMPPCRHGPDLGPAPNPRTGPVRPQYPIEPYAARGASEALMPTRSETPGHIRESKHVDTGSLRFRTTGSPSDVGAFHFLGNGTHLMQLGIGK